MRTCTTLADTTATTIVLRGLTRRILTPTDKVKALNKQLATAVKTCAPRPLEHHGIGPDTTATLLTAASDNPQQLTSAAAFAALRDVNPIQASPGKTTHHHLNHNGDRRANSALYTIALTQLGRNQRTRKYANRRTAQESPQRRSSAT